MGTHTQVHTGTHAAHPTPPEPPRRGAGRRGACVKPRTPGDACLPSTATGPPGVQRQLLLLVEVADLPAQQGHPALWVNQGQGGHGAAQGTAHPRLFPSGPCWFVVPTKVRGHHLAVAPSAHSRLLLTPYSERVVLVPGCEDGAPRGSSYPAAHVLTTSPQDPPGTLRSSSEEAEKNHVRCFLLMWTILKGKTLLDVVSSAARITLRAQSGGHPLSTPAGTAPPLDRSWHPASGSERHGQIWKA